MKENLNKENFFNEMMKFYPDAVKMFCGWIDKYKKENNWHEMFNSGYLKTASSATTEAPKYHDLPIAMQVGIFLEFMRSISIKRQDVKFIDVLGKGWHLMIKEYFHDLQLHLTGSAVSVDLVFVPESKKDVDISSPKQEAIVKSGSPAYPCNASIHGHPHNGMPIILAIASSVSTPEFIKEAALQTTDNDFVDPSKIVEVDARYRFEVAKKMIELNNHPELHKGSVIIKADANTSLFDVPKDGRLWVKAKFTGTNGSLGYETDKEYVLNIEPNGLFIKRASGAGRCEYGSLFNFLQNWTDVNVANTNV